jgi:alkylation response protein AidB-like acyl-CoA dehydrogenase
MKFVNMLAKYESCRYMVYNCAEIADDPKRYAEFLGNSALVKAYVGDTAIEGSVLAMNLMGSYGVMGDYKVEQFLRDVAIGPHVEGQTDVQRVIAAGYYLNH